MENKFELNEKELEQVIGGLGMTNPVSGLTEEEAMKIAEKLGNGRDMGSWRTMSGAQFLEWWQSSRKEERENTLGDTPGR